MAYVLPTNTVASNLSFTPRDFGFNESQWSHIMRFRFKREVPFLQFVTPIPGNLKNDAHYWEISPTDAYASYVTADSVGVDVTLADASWVHRGNLLDFETAPGTYAEREVASVDYTTDVVTLSAAIAVTVGFRVLSIGKAQTFGDTPDTTPVEQVTEAYNCLQEYNNLVPISKASEKMLELYGLNKLQVLVMGLLRRSSREMCRNLYYGRRQYGATANTLSKQGGVKWFIDNYGGGAHTNIGDLTWTDLTGYVNERQILGGLMNDDSYIFCNSTFAMMLHRLSVINNTGSQIWREGAPYPEIYINDTRFRVVKDNCITNYGQSGSDRAHTGLAFFLSMTDAEGTGNFRIAHQDGAMDDYLKIEIHKTHASARNLEIFTDYCLEVGEPQMHMYLQGVTGVDEG